MNTHSAKSALWAPWEHICVACSAKWRDETEAEERWKILTKSPESAQESEIIYLGTECVNYVEDEFPWRGSSSTSSFVLPAPPRAHVRESQGNKRISVNPTFPTTTAMTR